MLPPPAPRTGPAGLVLTASVARRFYFDGASKSEIANELGLSRFKVARLLHEARSTGLVRIEFTYRGEIDLALSERLRTEYGLRRCVVVDSPEDDGSLLRTNVGRAAAGLLAEIVTPDDVLGLAWARSLMAMRTALQELAPCTIVQLTGALSRPDVDESSIELVRDVARLSGGQAYFFYAPMLVPDASTARVMAAHPQIARATSRFPDLTKAVVGVGAWREGLSTVADELSVTERRALRRLGVRAEVAGILLDADGVAVDAALAGRVIGIKAARLKRVPDVIGVAHGRPKAGAVRAAVRGGLITSLVTHSGLAYALLDGS